MTVLANLWMQHGCPEKMTIHVKSTGETITLINGMPLEPEVRLTDRLCPVCSRRIPEGRKKFCSDQCKGRSANEAYRLRKVEQAREALRILSPKKAPSSRRDVA